MRVSDHYQPVPSWTPGEAGKFMAATPPGEYNLIDVRWPAEYAAGHIPGASLVPLGELEARSGEFDLHLTTIVYCAAGVRSRAAASILSGKGFEDIRNLTGGMNAWEGRRVEGSPEAGMIIFELARSLDEYVHLAASLEKGSRSFYSRLSRETTHPEASVLFSDLSTAEEHHLEKLLSRLGEKLPGPPEISGEQMEGGVVVEEVLEWARQSDLLEILEWALAMETGTYDLYVRMSSRAGGEGGEGFFLDLADEERKHLARLEKLMKEVHGATGGEVS